MMFRKLLCIIVVCGMCVMFMHAAWAVEDTATMPAPVSLPVPEQFADGVQIKVLLFKTTQVSIRVNTYANLYQLKSGAYVSSLGVPQADIRVGDASLIVNGEAIGATRIRLSSPDNTYYLQGKKYAGDVLIMQKNGEILIVNEIDLELYLKGVLPSEMFASWHEEALKAQAVVSRTYAVFAAINRAFNDYHVHNNTFSQVYDSANAKLARTNAAVDATAGEIMVLDGEVFPAYFHSTCGGHTTDSEYVWKDIDHPSLQTVYCPFCWESPHYKWDNSITAHELNARLQEKGYVDDDIVAIGPGRVSETGRLMTIDVETVRGEEVSLWANDLRVFVLPDIMKSTLCDIQVHDGRVIFDGYGFGHGAGMCQWGAKKMAEEGYEYAVIVNFYYRLAKIKHMYQPETEQ